MEYILLLIGFVLLIKGADFAVSGGSGIAAAFRISPVIIGLTVIAFGTSLPEMAVSVTGSITGQNGIAVGNVIGSNIFNLLVVGGLSAMFCPMPVDIKLLKRDIPISMLGALFIVAFSLFPFIGGADTFTVGRIGGLVMLLCFCGYMALLLKDARQSRAAETAPAEQERSLILNVIFTVGGLAAIVFGSDLVVDSATAIAYSFGLSETFVGLTIVSIGTSLPELVTSVVASKKGSNEIALGNIIGSNIFNLLLVLALAAVISPITVPTYLFTDGLLLTVISLFAIMFCGRNKKLDRGEGVIFLLVFIVYFAYITLRG